MSDVFAAIAAVQSDMRVGIAKAQDNKQQGFKYRGIDDLYNALSEPLAKHKLVILPRVVNREITEKTSRNGGVITIAVLTVEFDFISGADGSKHTVVMQGEAMDMADKATNKAFVAAYKYMCFQVFCVPTGVDDADEDTIEVSSKLIDAVCEYRRMFDSIATIKDGIKAKRTGDPQATDLYYSAAEEWFTLTDAEKTALFIAPSKGGIFTTDERAEMKSREFRLTYYPDATGDIK